jgi:predicted transcriptional regulator
MATAVELDMDIQLRVEHLAQARHTSARSVIHEALKEYISREEKREEFRQDALASLEHYERTGLHLTDEEVDQWFAKLEAGEDAKLPECHT